ncbi:MAG: flavodoxin [Candidatus Omnitrophota bacterium]
MKALIAYYSYTGNTQKIAKALEDILSVKCEVATWRLEPTDESVNFFAQCVRAFRRKRASLPDEGVNITDYDVICVGTPVWAFAPAPAVNTFLDKLGGLDGKDAICFTTYGSGTGVKKCVNTMVDAFKQRKAFKISNFNIQQGKVDNASFVEAAIRKALEGINI